MTISTETLARMTATANAIGEHFAREPDPKVWKWLAEARRELAEECDPLGTPGLILQLDIIDRMLDTIEARRSKAKLLHSNLGKC
jgi:hypothetical protein